MDAKSYIAQAYRVRFEKSLEREYVAHLRLYNARATRVGGMVGILALVSFLIFQRIRPDGLPQFAEVAWLWGVVAGFGAAIFYLSTNLKMMPILENLAPFFWGGGTWIGVQLSMAVEPERRAFAYGAFMLLIIANFSVIRGRYYQTIVSGLTVTATFLLAVRHYGIYSEIRYGQITMYFLVANALGIGMSFILERKDRTLFLSGREVEAERQRADLLLYDMLPPSIAERLKRGDRQIAEHHADVTVLFADLVGFTKLSEALPVKGLVRLLDDLFAEFDRIMAKHGVEKIKTIGDAYMAAAGVPLNDPQHAGKAAAAALEMLEATRLYRAKTGFEVEIRIGLNSGSLIAGVIGTKKRLYDIWGSTVNIASRMQSLTEPSTIQVSGATWTLLRHDFRFAAERRLEVKGIGEMSAYRLEAAVAPDRTGTLTEEAA